jgi:DNA-3-methyladenine glycosylase
VALPRRFYLRPAPAVARDLLGCVLVSRRGRSVTAGRIVETEAYLGPEDQASHAAFRPGSRHLFYGHGGIAYVFVAYGVHACLNAITGRPGDPGCVLIRAVEPVAGLSAMARRRGVAGRARRLASGPGNVTRALAVGLADNGTDLVEGPLTIEAPDRPLDFQVARGPRVGITRSIDLPLRFWIAGNSHVSRGAVAAQRARSDAGSNKRSGGDVLTATERTSTRSSSLPARKTSWRYGKKSGPASGR